MSREFDQLESQFRRRAQRDVMSLPNLQELRETPPSYKPPADPSQDTFRERFAPFSTDPIGDQLEQIQKEQLQRNRIIRPGTRERFLDPTKVISDIPPSLNLRTAQYVATPEGTGAAAGTLPQPDYMTLIERLNAARKRAQGIDQPPTPVPGLATRAMGGPVEAGKPYQVGEQGPEAFVPQQVADAGARPPLPPGFEYTEPQGQSARPPLPPGFEYTEAPKAERFLRNVTPEGPISGLISMMRLSGQAAQGRAPELMTNPELAIPSAVQGGIAGTSARAMGGPRLPLTTPEAPVPPPAPRQLTYQPDFEAIKAAKLAGARTEAKRVRAKLAESGDLPAESTGAPIEMSGPAPPEVSRTMLQPHINSIMATAARTQAPIKALEGALPGSVLAGALQEPPKAAAIAQWLKVYERVELAKFSPAAVSSLALATRNLNSNLGTDITIQNVFNRMKPLSTITRPEE